MCYQNTCGVHVLFYLFSLSNQDSRKNIEIIPTFWFLFIQLLLLLSNYPPILTSFLIVQRIKKTDKKVEVRIKKQM